MGSSPASSGVYGSVTMERPSASRRKQAWPYQVRRMSERLSEARCIVEDIRYATLNGGGNRQCRGGRRRRARRPVHRPAGERRALARRLPRRGRGQARVRGPRPRCPARAPVPGSLGRRRPGWARHHRDDRRRAPPPGCRLWQVLGMGLDHAEVDRILGRGIALANTPGQFSAIALAEHALMLLLAVAKQLPEATRNCRIGRMYHPISEELAGQVLGIVGLGASGRELARRAAPLGLRVRAVDVVPPPEPPRELRRRALRRPRRARRPAGRVGLRLAARPAERLDAPPDRRAPAGADEADAPC